MRFIWFWIFWHWSRESFRSGSLLRSPLHGIGSHWDEWFRHEASENDLKAIAAVGRSKSTQRQFISWIFRDWVRETEWRGNRMVPRFVVGQLAHLPPFNQWPAFEKYRTSYRARGISALVLTDTSAGKSEDVRTVEAIALPIDSTMETIVSEGFQANSPELGAARSAARSLLRGKGLLIFLARWAIGGGRPYPRWLSVALSVGWVAAAGLILFLLVGPEPGNELFAFTAALLSLWCGLVLVAVAVVARESFRAWRTGRELSGCLERSQVRLRMNGGLTLKGGSAGLPFCLNILMALYNRWPGAVSHSWIWRRLFSMMHSESRFWAGTGVITANGSVLPVVIDPKLHACLMHEQIRHVLTPQQREANEAFIDQSMETSAGALRKERAHEVSFRATQVGFAAEKPRLRIHRCRHVGQAIMALGGFGDRWQVAANAFAAVVSAVMIAGLPDLRSILLPHPAPIAVEPASPSPYYVWASLDTRHPEYFRAVLESGYWSNRRADVKRYGGVNPSVRAEIHLHRLIGRTASNDDDGAVWIERRRRFLSREFLPGERVGRYSISYLTRLGHE